MDSSDPWQLAIMVFMLFLSIFFSSAETAFTAVNRLRLRALADENNRKARQILTLLEKPNRLLSTVLVGNNMVNIIATTIGTALAIRYFGPVRGLTVATVTLTLIILVFCEITPKVYAASNAERVVLMIVRPFAFTVALLYPITRIFTGLTNLMIRLTGGKVISQVPYITEEELRTMVDVSQEEGLLESEEKEMIHNIFEFSETPVKDVMIPRTDIVAISLEAGFDDLAVIIREEQFSRIPVYDGSVDSIVGVIYVKDLFGLTDADRDSFELRNYLRDAYFIPEMKRIGNLFEEMRALKIHMAVVLDEYGGTAGLVTIEDLVEEIVGDIADEYDQELAPLFINVDDNTVSIDAAMRIEEVNEMMGSDIPDDDAESIGGFVLSRMERIPEEGERFEWHNMEFIIDKMDGRRINRITIKKMQEDE